MALWALAAGAVGFKAFAVWAYCYTPESDCGIAGLMARHMAAGLHWPVFYYGQEYMGSLEPMIGAGFVRLFGSSMAVVASATAVVSLGMLALLFVWAERLGGWRAGVAACLPCLLGSETFAQYLATPRGGYAVTLLLGVGLILLAARLGGHCGRRRFDTLEAMGLGLLAGVGWWTNQLIAVFLVPAALLLLWGRRLRIPFSWMVAGALGFAAGAFPWIRYAYGRGHWLGFGGDLGEAHFWRSAARFVFDLRELMAMGDDGLFAILRVLAAVLLALAFLAGWRSTAADYPSMRRLLGAAPVLIVLFNLVFLALSPRFERYPSLRYLLPSYLSLAVMLGVGTERLARRVRPWIAWAPLALILSGQVAVAAFMVRIHIQDRAKWRTAPAFEAFAREHGIDAFRADYRHHWINFATDERVCVCTEPQWDRYRPYRARAIAATNPAVVHNHGDLLALICQDGGTGRVESVGGRAIVFDLRAPFVNPPLSEKDCLVEADPALGDWDLRTALTGAAPMNITLKLNPPARVAGLRMLCRDNEDALIERVEAVRPDGERVTLLDEGRLSFYFWSDGVLCPRGILYAQRVQFASIEAAELVVRVAPVEQEFSIPELHLLGPPQGGEPKADAMPDWDDLADMPTVYAPRGLSERLRARGANTVIPADAYEYADGPEPLPPPRYPRIHARRGAAMIVRGSDAAMARRVLAAAGYAVESAHRGGYAMLSIRPSGDEATDLCWTEWGPMRATETMRSCASANESAER